MVNLAENRNGIKFATFSIRIPEYVLDKVEEVVQSQGRNRNSTITALLRYGLSKVGKLSLDYDGVSNVRQYEWKSKHKVNDDMEEC